MRDLSRILRTVRGHPIASMAELQLYAYEVPEGSLPPPIMSRLTAGEDVDPRELYLALEGEARATVAHSDAALEVVEAIRQRLTAVFPEVRKPT